MSQTMSHDASSSNGMTDDKAGAQSKRFTPLRSYVIVRRLSREDRSDLAFSRLIPVPRLQG